MPIEQQEAIAAEVMAALESNQLELPTLPDMAVKIRNALDDPNVSADQLINIISSDPAVSAHIIKAANSAALSNGTAVVSLRSAVSRLGYRMMHTLVITVTMEKLFKADSPLINRELKRLWEQSRTVAANSFVIALHQKHLKPEQAMLAGLIHNLGALPLCIYADRHHPRLDQAALDELIRRFGKEVGTKLLQNWNFSRELVDVVANHENLQRNIGTEWGDYTDVVAMAHLQMPSTAKFVAWQNVPGTARLGFTVAQSLNFLDDFAEQLSNAQEMLGMPATASKPVAQSTVPLGDNRIAIQAKSEQESGLLAFLRKLFRL